MFLGIERLRDRLAELGHSEANLNGTSLLHVTLVARCLRHAKIAINFHRYMELRLSRGFKVCFKILRLFFVL